MQENIFGLLVDNLLPKIIRAVDDVGIPYWADEGYTMKDNRGTPLLIVHLSLESSMEFDGELLGPPANYGTCSVKITDHPFEGEPPLVVIRLEAPTGELLHRLFTLGDQNEPTDSVMSLCKEAEKLWRERPSGPEPHATD